MNSQKNSGGASAALKSLLVTAVVSAAYYYVVLPPINLMSEDFYIFLVVIALIFILSWSGFAGTPKKAKKNKQNDYVEYEEPRERLFIFNGAGYDLNPRFFEQLFRGGKHKGKKKLSGGLPQVIALGVILASVLVLIFGSIASMTMFHSDAYYNLLSVETGDFAEDVSEVSYKKIPMLDKDSAVQLGRRALGSISSNSNLVSQFEVSYDYSQINYQEKPVRVSPLEYGNLIKWFNNRSEGIPAYVIVNMVTQEAQLVKLDEGMKYMTCEHFSRNLYRHLRFQFPTYMFGDVNFEVDDEGNPWWVCSREVHTIGLFGGVDVKGAVMVNAVTGESEYCEEVPTWVDRVYDAELLVGQYNYHGALGSGWVNSWLGQKGVTITTDGYNYIAMNDDVYMYTGVTSAGSDESNVGFILVNQRTKEARYYNVTGAEEFSAMSSAEGAVQHLNYMSTFPILLNISDEPTYFMALKDSAQLVKMYAMVNVGDYQITAIGSTVAACQSAYEQLLIENGITVTETVDETDAADVETAQAEGKIADIRTAVISGNTYYYVALEGSEKVYYSISAAAQRDVVILNKGDEVTVTYAAENAADSGIVDAVSVVMK